jgi:hypothetical protein
VKYENPNHNLTAQISKDWKLQEEFENLSMNIFIVQWILPKIYSEIEKADIANAVSVTCLTDKAIKNVKNLVNYEFSRIGDVLIRKEKLDDKTTSYTLYTKINGLEYKSKYYFLHKNGVGYIINFTATEGTYGKNLSKFEEFYRGLTIAD